MTAFSGRNVLVTGASGFVGRHVVGALTAAGARVHGLGLDPSPPALALESWQRVELADAAAMIDAVAAARPEFIVHLAGQPSAGLSFDHPVDTYRANTLGTWHLIQGVRAAAPRARVLVVGTGEVYGPQPEGTRVGEGAPFRPVSPYALSKAAADALAEIAAQDGLDVVRTRSFAHAGPGQDPRFALPSWARQLAAIERGAAEPVIRVGNLDITRDLSDVRDVARAYLELLARGRPGAAYNVCRGEGVTLARVLDMLRAMSGAALRIERDAARLRPADVPYLVGDPSAIQLDTGWRVEIAFERTLRDVLEDARANAPVA